MSDDTDPQDPAPNDAIGRMLAGLGKALEQINQRAEREHEAKESERHARAFVEQSGGIAIPMGIDIASVPEEYRSLVHGLMIEQGRASLFMSQLDDEHPYRALFTLLAESWDHAAVMGALHIAKHNVEHHGAEDIQVGPSEFSGAWASIAVAVALGGIRFGQANPDAFKGLEGIEPGEIDSTITQLIDWAAEEHRKGGEAAPEEA